MTHKTISSYLEFKCCAEGCDWKLSMAQPPKTRMAKDEKGTYQRIEDSSLNVLYVLSFLMMGDGAAEASKLLGLLGLPHDTSMDAGTFKQVESRLAPFIEDLKESIIMENVIAEVKRSSKLSDEDFK